MEDVRTLEDLLGSPEDLFEALMEAYSVREED